MPPAGLTGYELLLNCTGREATLLPGLWSPNCDGSGWKDSRWVSQWMTKNVCRVVIQVLVLFSWILLVLFVCQGKDFGQKSRLFIEIRYLSCQNSDLNLDFRSREEGWAIWIFIVVQCSHSILRQYNRVFIYLWTMEYSWEACIKRQHQFPSKLAIWSGLSSKIEKIFCNCSCKGIAHCSKMKHPLFKCDFFSYNPCPLTGWTDFFFSSRFM